MGAAHEARRRRGRGSKREGVQEQGIVYPVICRIACKWAPNREAPLAVAECPGIPDGGNVFPGWRANEQQGSAGDRISRMACEWAPNREAPLAVAEYPGTILFHEMAGSWRHFMQRPVAYQRHFMKWPVACCAYFMKWPVACCCYFIKWPVSHCLIAYNKFGRRF